MAKATIRKRITPDAVRASKAVALPNIGRPHALARASGDPTMLIDTLTNLITGMGTSGKDKATHTFFGYQDLPKVQIDAAYRGDWIARKAVDIIAEDATREWRSWQGDADDITALENEEKRLRFQKKVKTAMTWARLYGGAALVLGVDGQGLASAPLDWEKVKQGQLKFVHVVSRYDLSAADGQIDDDLASEFYGEPLMWRRQTIGGGYLDIHPSRVIRFVGMENPDTTLNREGWGDSVLQVIGDAIVGAGTTTQSIAQLVAEAKIDIVKLPGMSEKMASQKYQENLKARFSNASMMKSLYSTLLVDSAEEWDRLNQNFTNLDDILKIYLLIASAAVDVPSTRFLSQSPAGLSSTGEADLRNYYDKLSSQQNNEVTPTLERADNVLIMSALGQRPDELWYEWGPLWQLTPTEAATIALQKSQIMTADVNAGLFPPQMLYQMRLNQLIEDGTYPGIEQIEDEFGDDIEERQAQEQEAEAQRLMEQAAANENEPGGVQPGEVEPGGGNPGGNAVGAAGGGRAGARKAVGDAMLMADRIAGRDNNPNHDPDNGQFSEEGGTSVGKTGLPILKRAKGGTHEPLTKAQGEMVKKRLASAVAEAKAAGLNLGRGARPKSLTKKQGENLTSRFNEYLNAATEHDTDDSFVARFATISDVGRAQLMMAMDASSPPRPLYVHRKVINQAEIKAWAKKVGFASSLDDMHVTLIYSKQAVDWLKVPTDYWSATPDDKGNFTIPPGGPRVMQQFGKAVVLSFANTSLQYRHASIMREVDNISYTHDDYTPHITITYQGMPPGDADVLAMQPYQGKIVLGPELFEVIKEDFNNETDAEES